METDLPSRRRTTSISFMRELRSDTLIVFLSDRHIGGDPGCDAFEAADELQELFDELAEREEHEGPVELVLAGDFFDLLQVGSSREGLDRAGETVMRPEYQSLFAALRRFNEFEGHRTIYIPGNHDAEVFWNPRVRQTLMSRGLVSEFAPCYSASLVPEQTSDGESKVRSRAVYCEHGNQFDPANVVSDYTDPLDTPLGHHLVTDFTRRIAPVGRIAGELDLSDLKRVYPLVEIPRWIASRLFYDLMSRVLRYLLLPLLVAYAAYRGVAYYLASRAGSSATLWGSFPSLPEMQELFLDIYFFAILAVIVLGVFFIAVRRTVRRALSAFAGSSSPDSTAGSGGGRAARILEAVEESALGTEGPPMADDAILWPPDVFVFGHTHTPSLEKLKLPEGGEAAVVNSGCWLRQLSPVPARLHGPPVFVSRFTCTHARVYLEGPENLEVERLRVEL